MDSEFSRMNLQPPLVHEDSTSKLEEDRAIQKLKNYAAHLPYAIESTEKMQTQYLDKILLRLTQAIDARSDSGFAQWHGMFNAWCTLKYPIPREKRILLSRVYFHLCLTPSLPVSILASAIDGFMTCAGRRKLMLEDMRLPWMDIHSVLCKDLFLNRRQLEYTTFSWYMAYLAENARRFFHPAAINEMLQTFVPNINATDSDSLLSSLYYMATFLPGSHPSSYLPFLFRLWESVNSYMYDERMLELVSRLAQMHVDPAVSDPARLETIPDDAKSSNEGRPQWNQDDLEPPDSASSWSGIFKDVGIFTDSQWHLLMCKCLASMEIPLADAGSLTTAPTADNQVGFELGARLPKPEWRIVSLASIVVYSMAPDGRPTSTSTVPASGVNTPQGSNATPRHNQPQTYLAGCKALESLAQFIRSTESFFHPSNAGPFTSDLTAFLKHIAIYFNRRWQEERKVNCRTPVRRRLTTLMKLEVVKAMRTVMLLAMFSEDPTTVSNVQSCLKIMSLLEPHLIVMPILERAIPSLEALVETQRTIAVIKALTAVVPALASRSVYYAGAKHILPLLHLLLPGIDLNDPEKTLCTTTLLIELAQNIYFGQIMTGENGPTTAKKTPLSFDAANTTVDGDEPYQSREEEDILLAETTASFSGWVASFCRQVIQLLDNLPEEASSGGATEVQVVDAVVTCCMQIFSHLSDPAFDMVLDIIFEYATSNIKSNSLRAIHQLVECLANTDPTKTLSKFFVYCSEHIRIELESGASSIRTTSVSSPLPSDLSLHWYLAILRGAFYNDGTVVLKYKEELLSLLHLLTAKTFSKQGYSWTGDLIASVTLTLSHMYPLENRLVNPDVWNSEEFRTNHHHYWGKRYKHDEVKISWHVPNHEEIGFTIRILKELMEPMLEKLSLLLAPGQQKDRVWVNDFCRFLTFLLKGFSGIPSFAKEIMSAEDLLQRVAASDTLNEIPAMVAHIDPVASGFCLTDPSDPRYHYVQNFKRRFGELLHRASISLLGQGEENTVDAVYLLIKAIRIHMLEYGDSKDSYFYNSDRHTSAKNATRYFEGQKDDWPRHVLVRRARWYHSARLYLNSLERKRGPLEDLLIDDVVEFSMWHYPIVRQNSQSLLEAISSFYDGVRRRALPILYAALTPGTDDDRMKGALWTLRSSSFGKYAAAEPVLTGEILKNLFACQHNEKPSIQDLVASVFENCLSVFTEPNFDVCDVANTGLELALSDMKLCLVFDPAAAIVTESARTQAKKRKLLANNVLAQTTEYVLEVCNSDPHWKYAITASKCLRVLVRRDAPLSAGQIRYFLEICHSNNADQRYYGQRSVVKSLRYLKLRTYAINPSDIRALNPLLETVGIPISHESTTALLNSFKIPVTRIKTPEPIYLDKPPPGWLALTGKLNLYRPPGVSSTFQPWELASAEATEMTRALTTSSAFWKKLSVHYSEEQEVQHEVQQSDQYMSQDNVSCVKSIFQLLDDAPFEAMRPIVEDLLLQPDQNKQRCVAELLAGLLGASKHWPAPAQRTLWSWFTPLISKIFGLIKSDTLTLWGSWVEYLFHRRDPRRLQPLVDFLTQELHSLDFNAESSFRAVKTLTLFRAFYEELEWKFFAWQHETLDRCWPEIMRSEHEEVRNMISELIAYTAKTSWRPRPSLPSVETVVRECRTTPIDYDIMGMRGYFHQSRISELIETFKTWREQRTPGPRAPQSTYDRVGVTVCRWLFQSIHDTHAISVFDYIIPLMPELFRFTEINDNDELSWRANTLLVQMCGVTPPRSLVAPLLEGIFEAIQSSPSWRVRLKALPLLQVFYFRQLPSLSEDSVGDIIEILCKCLDDDVVEVREMASTTLSGILRLSPRRSILTLKDRFVRLARSSRIPGRHTAGYNDAVRRRHAAVLGMSALLRSFPYTVEPWMPSLLSQLADMSFDPSPISRTIQECGRSFKKTHQDTWHEDCKRFNEDELAALSTLLTGSSYYA